MNTVEERGSWGNNYHRMAAMWHLATPCLPCPPAVIDYSSSVLQGRCKTTTREVRKGIWVSTFVKWDCRGSNPAPATSKHHVHWWKAWAEMVRLSAATLRKTAWRELERPGSAGRASQCAPPAFCPEGWWWWSWSPGCEESAVWYSV